MSSEKITFSSYVEELSPRMKKDISYCEQPEYAEIRKPLLDAATKIQEKFEQLVALQKNDNEEKEEEEPTFEKGKYCALINRMFDLFDPCTRVERNGEPVMWPTIYSKGAQRRAIQVTEEIRDVALADGEMAITEEQFYINAQLHERLVEIAAVERPIFVKKFEEDFDTKYNEVIEEEKAVLAKLDVAAAEQKESSSSAAVPAAGFALLKEITTLFSTGVQNFVKQNKSKLSEDLRKETLNDHLDAFTRLYKAFGELKFKKEVTLEHIDRSIRITHIHLEECIDSLDPLAKKYADEKKDLYKRRTEIEEEIEMVVAKMSEYDEKFTPMVETLAENGIEFTHPREILESNNRERRKKIAQYRLFKATTERDRVDAETKDLFPESDAFFGDTSLLLMKRQQKETSTQLERLREELGKFTKLAADGVVPSNESEMKEEVYISELEEKLSKIRGEVIEAKRKVLELEKEKAKK